MRAKSFALICKTVARSASDRFVEGRPGGRFVNAERLEQLFTLVSEHVVDEVLRYERCASIEFACPQVPLVQALEAAEAALKILDAYEDIDSTTEEVAESVAKNAEALRQFRLMRGRALELAKEKAEEVQQPGKRFQFAR